MKKTWKLAIAASALIGFTACSNGDNNGTTESENIESTEQIETDMETDMNMTDSTNIMQDTTLNDGMMERMEEEQPPR